MIDPVLRHVIVWLLLDLAIIGVVLLTIHFKLRKRWRKPKPEPKPKIFPTRKLFSPAPHIEPKKRNFAIADILFLTVETILAIIAVYLFLSPVLLTV